MSQNPLQLRPTHSIFRSANHKSVMLVNPRPCLIPHSPTATRGLCRSLSIRWCGSDITGNALNSNLQTYTCKRYKIYQCWQNHADHYDWNDTPAHQYSTNTRAKIHMIHSEEDKIWHGTQTASYGQSYTNNSDNNSNFLAQGRQESLIREASRQIIYHTCSHRKSTRPSCNVSLLQMRKF